MTKKLKIILLCIGLAVILAVVAAVVVISTRNNGNGDEPDTSGAPDTEDTAPKEDKTYSVTVKTEGGRLIPGAGVYIYADDTLAELVWFADTDENGSMSFTDTESSTYVAVLDKLPDGYNPEKCYHLTGEATEITLKTAVISETDLSGVSYELGDVIRDFTVTDTDGDTHTASEILAEKKVLVLNFWYVECAPCRSEFPYLNEAYKNHSDKASLLALNHVNKDDSAIAAFKSDNALDFPMAQCSDELASAFELTAYPTTVVIDRYGVICLIVKGEVPDTATFDAMLAHFTADDYTQSLVGNISDLVTEAPDTEVFGTKESPYEIGGVTEFDAEVPADGLVYYNLYKAWGMILEIEADDAYVVYGDKTYKPENGKVSVYLDGNDTFAPASLLIGNSSDADKTYKVKLTYPEGTMSNPYELTLGPLETHVEKGNDQGVFYEYTAKETGTFTFSILSVTSGVSANGTLYNLNTYVNRSLLEDGDVDADGGNGVSVYMNAGDVLQLTVATLPDENNEYPEADIVSVTEFTVDPVDPDEPVVPNEPETVTYTFTAVDKNGKAVAGVTVNVTGKDVNEKGKTASNGKLTLELTEGEYTVSVTAADGYTVDTAKYTLKKGTTTLKITLTKKSSGGTSSGGDTTPKTTSYTVTVLDANGKAKTGVTVKLVKDGKTAASGTVNSSGKFTQTLDTATYTVELSFTGTALGYDKKSAKVTASSPSVKIYVAEPIGTDYSTLYNESDAYYISTGAVYTDLSADERNYFLFVPTKSGVYEFTTTSTDAVIGYFGGTSFIQSVNIADDYKNNKFTITVKEGSVGVDYIIGIDVDSGAVGGTVVKVTRTGDIPFDPADDEYIVYKKTVDLSTYTLPSDAAVKDFDLTAKTSTYNLVLNESDGFYHLGSEDGPLVVAYLGKKTTYLASLAEVLDTSNLGKYFYDDNGKYLYKERYNECLLEYLEYMDKSAGVYPLTEDLKYIITNAGEHKGWWDADSETYLFSSVKNLNSDIAWLFLCGYVSE